MTQSADLTMGFAHLIDQGQILPATVSQAVMLGLSDQVASLHASGRIHRMLTPAGIEVDSDGSVCLKPSATVCWLGRSPITGEWLPPELRDVAPFELPSN